MAEGNSTLGESDSTDFVFSPGERKLTTQAYDLSIQTLVDQWTDETLIIPKTQREYIWDNGKASRLIESLILRIPIPVLYFAENEKGKYEIIDGHQRVGSVARYFKNEFSLSGLWVLKEYSRCRFHQLPDKIQRHIKTRIMRAVIIQEDSHPDMKFEVFERLNQGSISLNSQELRNSMYRGLFNDLLRELARDSQFRELIGTQAPRKRMVDEELILRFFSLHERLASYRAPLKRFLNGFMEEEQNAPSDRLSYFKDVFHRTVGAVHEALGNSAFRITNAMGVSKERFPNRALFEAQMLAFSWAAAGSSYNKQAIFRSFADRYQSQPFLDAIQKATGNTSNVEHRITEAVSALREANVSVDAPL